MVRSTSVWFPRAIENFSVRALKCIADGRFNLEEGLREFIFCLFFSSFDVLGEGRGKVFYGDDDLPMLLIWDVVVLWLAFWFPTSILRACLDDEAFDKEDFGAIT